MFFARIKLMYSMPLYIYIHSISRKLSMSFLRWQNNLHETLVIEVHSLSKSCMLPQTQLSSKQSFISQLGWKEVFFFTNSFDELSCHFSHIHKGKKKIKIHLPSIVSQLQRLRGRLPFPLAKTYEHKKKKKNKMLYS